MSLDAPSLVKSIMAVPEDDMSIVNISTSVNIKALSSDVSDVSS